MSSGISRGMEMYARNPRLRSRAVLRETAGGDEEPGHQAGSSGVVSFLTCEGRQGLCHGAGGVDIVEGGEDDVRRREAGIAPGFGPNFAQGSCVHRRSRT